MAKKAAKPAKKKAAKKAAKKKAAKKAGKRVTKPRAGNTQATLDVESPAGAGSDGIDTIPASTAPSAPVAEPAAQPASSEENAPALASEAPGEELDTEGAPSIENPDLVDGDPEAEENVKLEYVVDEAENRHVEGAEGEEGGEGSEAREKIKKIIPKKFWMVDPWRSLLDPNLAREADILKYDLSKLIRDFFDLMLKEELIDFRISGIATYSAARMHHWKILETIKEEEKEEEKRQRERLERQVPKAIAQPLREARKIATVDDLVGAMRRAIIETMQKREKLRLRRVVREQKRTVMRVARLKGQLPKELLKHITGKGETADEMIQNYYEKIKAAASLNSDGIASFFDLCNVIKQESTSKIEERFKMIKLFMSMCFLGTSNNIFMEQEDLFTDIVINLKKRRSVVETASEEPDEEDDELEEVNE
jgi:hypothetical protein